jgi:CubicO group peptidase (beta-lactamase class C family)
LFVEKEVFKPLGLEKKIFFMRHGKRKGLSQEKFAATEKCPWRGKTICGEVHDDNCYALGGVAGHSGLFGNIESVSNLVCFLHDMWNGEARHPNINNQDLVNFLVRQNDKYDGRALGFDMPARRGASCGQHFSDKSVGHLGFSGTSFWVDPEKEISVVLLTNRVHPLRQNTKIKKFRPFFHDRVMEKILEN